MKHRRIPVPIRLLSYAWPYKARVFVACVSLAGLTAFLAEVLAQWETAHDAMGKAMAKWAEDSLDRYVLKHPAMGPLTVREMLMFAHYHESHHLNLLAGRRA